MYYKATGREDGKLRDALNKYATNNQGWGYRGLMDWLVRDGFTDNHKRVCQVYAEEGIQLGQQNDAISHVIGAVSWTSLKVLTDFGPWII